MHGCSTEVKMMKILSCILHVHSSPYYTRPIRPALISNLDFRHQLTVWFLWLVLVVLSTSTRVAIRKLHMQNLFSIKVTFMQTDILIVNKQEYSILRQQCKIIEGRSVHWSCREIPSSHEPKYFHSRRVTPEMIQQLPATLGMNWVFLVTKLDLYKDAQAEKMLVVYLRADRKKSIVPIVQNAFPLRFWRWETEGENAPGMARPESVHKVKLYIVQLSNVKVQLKFRIGWIYWLTFQERYLEIRSNLWKDMGQCGGRDHH